MSSQNGPLFHAVTMTIQTQTGAAGGRCAVGAAIMAAEAGAGALMKAEAHMTTGVGPGIMRTILMVSVAAAAGGEAGAAA